MVSAGDTGVNSSALLVTYNLTGKQEKQIKIKPKNSNKRIEWKKV